MRVAAVLMLMEYISLCKSNKFVPRFCAVHNLQDPRVGIELERSDCLDDGRH